MRKSIQYIVTDEESRDFGKEFKITEMPAVQAEKWCYKAVGAMLKSGLNLPDDVMSQPSSVLAAVGVGNFLRIDYDDLEPLLNDMFGCVEFYFDKTKLDTDPFAYRKVTAKNEFNDIEELGTLVNLRLEVFKLHMGFLKAVVAPLLNQFTTKAE